MAFELFNEGIMLSRHCLSCLSNSLPTVSNNLIRDVWETVTFNFASRWCTCIWKYDQWACYIVFWYQLHTCLEQWPAYRRRELIFCTRFIFGLRCLISNAAHIPTTALVFDRAILVLAAKKRSLFNCGACVESSLSNMSQLNCLRSSGFWLCRIEFTSSDAMALISLANSFPRAFTMYFFVVALFRASIAIVLWLLRAIALPMCFRRGVSTKVLGLA